MTVTTDNVAAVNDPPSAGAVFQLTWRWATRRSRSCFDDEGDDLTITITQPPQKGTAEVVETRGHPAPSLGSATAGRRGQLQVQGQRRQLGLQRSDHHDRERVDTRPPQPENTLPLAISGTAAVGQTLGCSQGSWTNRPDELRLPAGTATASCDRGRHLLQATPSPTHDAARQITGTATASNAGGASSATSAPVTPTNAAPENTAPPEISGTAAVGQTLGCSAGEAGPTTRRASPTSGTSTALRSRAPPPPATPSPTPTQHGRSPAR